jgi:protein-disulfide isomerase
MSLSRRSLILGVFGLFLGGVALYTASNQGLFKSGSEYKTFSEITSETQTDSEAADFDYVVGDQMIGEPDAPIQIIEYASLTCPHCANFHTETFSQLKEEYIDTGKANFILREVHFDRLGLWATMVARCGGENKYYAFVDLFLKSQQRWLSEDDPVAAIREIGRMGGLSQNRIETCLQDEEFAKSLLDTYQTHAVRDDIQSTPSFIINGEKYSGEKSINEMRNILDPLLE